jgi:activating signal cointegrator 1
MKVLTLRQPWASLVVMGAKKWETRSWKPSRATHYLIGGQGLLIHSSQKFDESFKGLLTYPPFKNYLSDWRALPLGCIIGIVSIGRVISTEDWTKEFIWPGMPEALLPEEKEFGNYERGRWAWELERPVQFEHPIKAKGSLAIWQYNGALPTLFRKSKSETL